METVTKTHIGAYGIIIKDDKIALIKKARGGYKGKLDLPGGGIEHTETPIEALHREIKEEVNCTVISEKLFDAVSTNITWQMEENLLEDLHHIGILYMVDVKELQLKEDADGLDSNGAEWYEIKNLNKDLLSTFAWYVINKIK
jgi:ADP-ribose pyrophosphatase YjhB (NUDIX family)